MKTDNNMGFMNPSRRRTITVITLSTFIIMLVLAVVTLAFIPAEDKTLIDDFMMPTVAFIAGYSYYLARQGKHERGAFFLIGTIFVVSLIYSIAVKNIGWQIATAMLVITTSLATSLFPRDIAGRISITAFALAVVIILIEIFLPGADAAPPRISSTIVPIILGLVYLGLILYQFSSFTLRNKLNVFALGTGLVSILLVSIITSVVTRQTLTNNTRANLANAARATMDEIDTYLGYNVAQISAEAQIPEVVQFMQASPEEQELMKNDILALFSSLSQRDPGNIGSYSLMDVNGLDILDTYTEDVGVLKSDRDYFINPKLTGKPFVSPVRYSPTSPDHAIYIGVPITNDNGEFLGVLRVRFRSTLLNEIMAGNNEQAGEGSYAMLLDEFNIIVAHSNNPSWISRTPTMLDDAAIFQLRSENRIRSDIEDSLTLNMPDFAEKLQTYTASEPYFTSTDEAWGEPVEVGIANSTASLFKVAYVLPQSIALQGVVQQTRITVIVALATGLLIFVLSLFVTRTITSPISAFATVAEDIASGNLSSRAQYNVDDELGGLANSFNRMTSQLQDSLGDLERRVAERTADLDMARLLSERRAQELQSISEISRTISTEQRIEILLPLITKLVSERFDFYHVGIFFVEDTRRFAYLQASNSQGGQIMLARGHRLELGSGLVGNVAQTGKSRIALDVGSDAVFFDNPDLPDTRSEMALPLNIRGQAIGVLDVQSKNPGAFTENDANTLGILADQIAVAIENARLFGQTQQARDEAEALYAQILRKEWGAFIQQESRIGFRQTATGGRHLSKPVDSNEIREALTKGRVVVMDGKGSRTNPTIAIPVQLRGQTIGILNIKAPTRDRKWNQDEVNLAQAVSDRLALALDNARLLQDSQRRAAKEAKIGEVTARIGTSINMRSVLQTAVEELGKALPGSEVIIQFQSEQDNGSAQSKDQ